VPAYSVWAYYAHGRQRRCQEDLVSLPSGRLEKTTRSSLHHVAQHRPTGSETTTPYAPRSSRFGSEPPSVEDDVDMILPTQPHMGPVVKLTGSFKYLITRNAADSRSTGKGCIHNEFVQWKISLRNARFLSHFYDQVAT